MSSGPETRVVERIRKAIVAEWPNAYILKTHGDGYIPAGTPDLLICVNGLFIGLEVKHQKPGETVLHAHEKATEAQKLAIQDIRAAGGRALVVVSPLEALEAIRFALGSGSIPVLS